MSNINPNNIDATFPIAGIDNDSQGFRDNFTNIRNNFRFAKSEIEDIVANVLVKNPLRGQASVNNDMNGSSILSATVADLRERILEITGTTFTLDHKQSSNYLVSLVSNLELFFQWPSNIQRYVGKIRLFVNVSGTGLQSKISFPTTSLQLLNIENALPISNNSIWFTQPGNYVFEFMVDSSNINQVYVFQTHGPTSLHKVLSSNFDIHSFVSGEEPLSFVQNPDDEDKVESLSISALPPGTYQFKSNLWTKIIASVEPAGPVAFTVGYGSDNLNFANWKMTFDTPGQTEKVISSGDNFYKSILITPPVSPEVIGCIDIQGVIRVTNPAGSKFDLSMFYIENSDFQIELLAGSFVQIEKI